jgi:hypothetical protein
MKIITSSNFLRLLGALLLSFEMAFAVEPLSPRNETPSTFFLN